MNKTKNSLRSFLMMALMLVFITSCQNQTVVETESQSPKEVLETTENGRENEIETSPKEDEQKVSPKVFAENNLSGLNDESGETLLSAQYDYISENFSDGQTVVVKDLKWGYLSSDAKEIIEPTYERAFPFSDGLGRIQQDGKFGFINVKGEIVYPAIYDDAHDFSNGLSAVKTEGQWFFIDTSGDESLYKAQKYDDITAFQDGLA